MQVGANLKTSPRSDWFLKFETMKLELQVIADQHAAVNMYPGLVHTACQFEKERFLQSLNACGGISTNKLCDMANFFMIQKRASTIAPYSSAHEKAFDFK